MALPLASTGVLSISQPMTGLLRCALLWPHIGAHRKVRHTFAREIIKMVPHPVDGELLAPRFLVKTSVLS
jgi:hypothetical protein